jgi:hypothetical protein
MLKIKIKKVIMKKIIIGIVLLFIIYVIGFVTWASIEPEQKSIKEIVSSLNIQDPNEVIGEASIGAISFTVTTLLDKNGGYTYNDLLAQLGFFDNMPNWEMGVLTQAQDAAITMSKDISRSQSQSLGNKHLKGAKDKLHYDSNKWFYFVRTEGEYRNSVRNLNSYLKEIIDPNTSTSQFYARADNLKSWLEYMSKQMGSLTKRLSASVSEERVNTDLANDPSAEQSTLDASLLHVKTPWMQIDDVFWEARGSTWALLHYMKAIRVDFKSVLKKKNALASIDQVIKVLEASQGTIWSPIILNGDGYGFVANHSLAMANYVSRANTSINDLINLLTVG